MSLENILLVKQNLWIFKIIIPMIFFFISILPLFSENATKTQTKPVIIEMMALSVVLFYIASFVLNFIVDMPLYKRGDKLLLKNRDEITSEFLDVNRLNHKVWTIEALGDENYLVKNNSNIKELPISRDHLYRKIKKK